MYDWIWTNSGDGLKKVVKLEAAQAEKCWLLLSGINQAGTSHSFLISPVLYYNFFYEQNCGVDNPAGMIKSHHVLIWWNTLPKWKMTGF